MFLFVIIESGAIGKDPNANEYHNVAYAASGEEGEVTKISDDSV